MCVYGSFDYCALGRVYTLYIVYSYEEYGIVLIYDVCVRVVCLLSFHFGVVDVSCLYACMCMY